MKFLDAHNAHDDADADELFQVMPMVDVVFILLAFFVLTVRFSGGEQDLTVGATEAGQVTGAAAQDLPAEILVRVRPGAGGRLWLAVGETVLPEDGLRDLTAVMQQINVPDLPVVIAADGALSVQQVAATMDAVLAGPMKQVSLARLTPAGEAP